MLIKIVLLHKGRQPTNMGIIRAYKCFTVLPLLAIFLSYANVPNHSSLILERSSTSNLVIKQHPFLISISAFVAIKIVNTKSHTFKKNFQDKISTFFASKHVISTIYRYLVFTSSDSVGKIVLSHICKLQI